MLAAKNVRALGHKVHAAEEDVLAGRVRSLLRELVGIAAEIGEADDLIALVVVPQNDDLAAQSRPSRGNAAVHGVIWEHKIIVQRTSSCRGCHFWSRFQSRMGYRHLTAAAQTGTGMLKASSDSSRFTAP